MPNFTIVVNANVCMYVTAKELDNGISDKTADITESMASITTEYKFQTVLLFGTTRQINDNSDMV